MQLKKNMQLELDIDSFGAEGEGVARWEGMPVFVPGALPGERIRALILKAEKKYAFAKVTEVLRPSAQRVAPLCPHYRLCGGCSCQHMTYAAQLEFKRNQVEGCLRHIGGIEAVVRPALGMDTPWRYRNKTAMPVAGTAGSPLIGYYARRSHRVVDISGCLLSSESAERTVAVIREWMESAHIPPYNEETHTGLIRHVMTRVSRSGDLMAVLVINGKRLPAAEQLLEALRRHVPEMVSLCISVNQKRGNVILGDTYSVLWGRDRLEDTLCGSRFLLSPLSFFQVNPEQTEKLYQTALSFAGLQGNEQVADLYCGAGTISLLLARHAAHVTGIEIVPDAIRDAKSNAVLNQIGNADFICGAAEAVLPGLVDKGLRPDVIVLDPPRKGAENAVLQAILQAAPRRIVYVSCNPATLARDARILCESGEYAVTACQPVDMFCQTSGIETVLLLSR